jgi:hypothetical protein
VKRAAAGGEGFSTILPEFGAEQKVNPSLFFTPLLFRLHFVGPLDYGRGNLSVMCSEREKCFLSLFA